LAPDWIWTFWGQQWDHQKSEDDAILHAYLINIYIIKLCHLDY
jgi:hypothetical protein